MNSGQMTDQITDEIFATTHAKDLRSENSLHDLLTPESEKYSELINTNSQNSVNGLPVQHEEIPTILSINEGIVRFYRQ